MLHTKACISSSLASLGNATTMLLNTMMYSYTETYSRNSYSLSLEMLLLSSGAY